MPAAGTQVGGRESQRTQESEWWLHAYDSVAQGLAVRPPSQPSYSCCLPAACCLGRFLGCLDLSRRRVPLQPPLHQTAATLTPALTAQA